jgi:excinuclease ABC subunit C
VLLRHFGSVAKLRTAGVDAVAEVPGFGPVLAAAVVERLAATTRPDEGEPDEPAASIPTSAEASELAPVGGGEPADR